jgi:2-polyprenyl-3-methyl-5-hydroxy-6-metoxy-1,4-benzoquinol methylase
MKRSKIEKSFLVQEKIRFMFTAQPKCKYVQKYLYEKRWIADIGCGVGIETSFIQRLSNFVAGVDIDLDLLKIAKNHLPSENKVNLLAGDAYHLPFKEKSFDVVVMFDVLEHLNNPLKVLTYISIILKDEGILILGVPNKYTFGETLQRFLHLLDRRMKSKLLWNVHHVNFFDITSLSILAKRSDFFIYEALIIGNPITQLILVLRIIISLISRLIFFNSPQMYKWIDSIINKNKRPKKIMRIMQFDKKLSKFFFYDYIILVMSKKR